MGQKREGTKERLAMTLFSYYLIWFVFDSLLLNSHHHQTSESDLLVTNDLFMFSSTVSYFFFQLQSYLTSQRPALIVNYFLLVDKLSSLADGTHIHRLFLLSLEEEEIISYFSPESGNWGLSLLIPQTFCFGLKVFNNTTLLVYLILISNFSVL